MAPPVTAPCVFEGTGHLLGPVSSVFYVRYLQVPQPFFFLELVSLLGILTDESLVLFMVEPRHGLQGRSEADGSWKRLGWDFVPLFGVL